MKILLIEDDDLVADSLARALKSSGYLVECTASPTRAELVLKTESYDAVILDLGLPEMDGLDFLKRIRSHKIGTPVLILTARDGYEQRIAGLDCGANDYVSKPFHLGELEARIRALMRLSCSNTTAIDFGQLTFDTVRHSLRRGEQLIELSPREYAVLEILIRNIGAVVTKRRISSLMSDWEEPVTYNAIDITIHRLRKKLEPFGVRLQTIRGLGFIVEP